MSRITLWGFYNYTDKKLFDDIRLPEAINKEELINLIMIECGDLFPYYQQPAYLKMQIDNFFNRKYDGFSKMAAALAMEYNPIENYDRMEDWTDKAKETGHDTSAESVRGKATDETHDNNTGRSVGEVSAMDSSSFVNDSQNTSTSSGSSNATTTNESSRGTSSTNARENESTHSGRVHGNIGVTTSMQMVEAELSLREYDLLERIVRLFEKDVIIQLY